MSLANGAIEALSWNQVREGLVDSFVSLNPFGGVLSDRSVLKVEDENFDPETGEQREVWCLAIASKRYALAVRDSEGEPVLVGSAGKSKRSEHGLGHLLSPEDPNPASEDKTWFDTWWLMLFRQAWGVPYKEPEWFDDGAIGRLTVTSPREERAFREYNATKRSYRLQVRPWNFLMVAYPSALECARKEMSGTLIAPYESNPRRRLRAPWVDRNGNSTGPRRIRTRRGCFRNRRSRGSA